MGGGRRRGKRGVGAGPIPPAPEDLAKITDAYLADLTLDGLKLLAGQLVLDVDVSTIEDRDDLLSLLRSNAL